MAAGKKNLPIAWEKELAERAKVAAAANTPMGLAKSITTRSGILSVDGNPVEGNELLCVILADLYENQYYTKEFDANSITVPDCYAFSDLDATNGREAQDAMVPHEEAENRQGRPADQDQNTLYEDGEEEGSGAIACRNCWANIMGTAEKGRGKACKNIRRLVLIPADALESPQALLDAEVRMLKVPVMSTNNYANFVQKLNEEQQRPPEAVVCKVKIVPDPKSQFKIQFEFEELIVFTQELYDALKKKIKLVRPIMLAPYPKAADLAEQQQSQPRGARPPSANRSAGKPGARTPGKQPTTAGGPKARKF